MNEEAGEPFDPAIVVPAYGRAESTRRTLRALFADGARTVVLVDDEGTASGDALAREFEALHVLRSERPLYWTGATSRGVEWALARGARDVLLFNQDVEVQPGYLATLAAARRRHPSAFVGSAILYAQAPATVWAAGGATEWFGRGIRVLHHGAPVASLPSAPYPADWLFGMGTLVPAEAFRSLGLPDAARFPMAWGDADFTLRARRAGWELLVEPGARLLHEVGAYDARVAGPPSLATYVRWLKDPKHNLSLSAHAEIWRRHGPRLLWPVSLLFRYLFLAVNFLRIRILFRGAALGPRL